MANGKGLTICWNVRLTLSWNSSAHYDMPRCCDLDFPVDDATKGDSISQHIKCHAVKKKNKRQKKKNHVRFEKKKERL